MSNPTLTRETVTSCLGMADIGAADATEQRTLAALCRQLGEALQEFGTHDSKCVLSRWCAGRPTKSGVYENLFGDKWYPKGEEPECTCGLSAALILLPTEGESEEDVNANR